MVEYWNQDVKDITALKYIKQKFLQTKNRQTNNTNYILQFTKCNSNTFLTLLSELTNDKIKCVTVHGIFFVGT